MRGKTKFALGVTLAFMLAAASIFFARSASASKFIFQNTLDNGIYVAVAYYDGASGSWVTQGWWAVDGNNSMMFTIENVDIEQSVYYVGINRDNFYLDSSTLNSDFVNRWVLGYNFRFDGKKNDRPADENIRLVRFYKCRYSDGSGAYVVRIDAKMS